MFTPSHRWLRLLPLFLAAFWLPFQAIAATSMSFCRHGDVRNVQVMDGKTHASVTSMAQTMSMGDCAQHGMDMTGSADLIASPQQNDSSHTDHPSSHTDNCQHCDNCGYCHLAGASLMPTNAMAVALLPTLDAFVPTPDRAPRTAIPEPPQHPPNHTPNAASPILGHPKNMKLGITRSADKVFHVIAA